MIHFTAARTAQIDADETLNKKYARILYEQKTATITADTSVAGTNAANLANPLTYSYWQADSDTAELVIDFGSSQLINCVAILLDNIKGGLIKFQYWAGVAYEDWDSDTGFMATSNNPIMFEATQKATERVRILINCVSTGEQPLARSVYAGQNLIMQRSIYGGHSPINLNRTNTIKPNYSEGGQFLGRSQVRTGLQSTYDWNNLTAAWYRSDFEQFAQSAVLTPWFIAWKPSSHADETAYCWTQGDISPSNTGTRDFMSVSVQARGFANG